MRLNGGLAPITLQDAIGKCAFTSLFGLPDIQVLTAAEIRARNPVWHSPALPDVEWNKTLVLPGGQTVGVCTVLASGDDRQPLRVPTAMWREQRQVRNYHALMLIHDDANATLDTADGSLGEPAVPRERPMEVEFHGLATRTAVFAQSNMLRSTTGAQEEQKQEEHEHLLPVKVVDDHDDSERKPD